jgi:methionyl-tRNA formyltransferase
MLPRYRGRAPVNWAILRGEREAGATLHYMVARADAGDIVDQQSVPILPDDTSADVLAKVAVVAEIVLVRSLPALFAGTAPRIRQDITQGEYVGRRRPEDGLIDWNFPAQQIHNLVRAVAPPFPGAFAWIGERRLGIDRTRLLLRRETAGDARLFGEGDRCLIRCRDGGVLEVLAGSLDGQPMGPAQLIAQFGAHGVSLS